MRKIYTIFAFIALGVVGMWGASHSVLKYLFADSVDRSQFGDEFGAITALFNALALLGLIFTIYQQHIDLQLQRQELADTRKELRKSAEAQHESQHALKAQVLAQRDAAMIAAMDTLIRLNREIISRDSEDEVAKRMPEYRNARQKLSVYSRALEKELKKYL